MQIAKTLARTALQEDVEQILVTQIGRCTLTTWGAVRSLPISRIVICNNGAEQYVASRNVSTFARLVKDVQPDRSDLAESIQLLNTALPRHLWLLPDDESEYINRETGHRPQPLLENSDFVFYCNDCLSGKVLDPK